MDSVGADYQVEASRRPVEKRDLHPVVVLDKGLNGVVKAVVAVVTRSVVQDAGQPTAQDLNLGDDAFAPHETDGHGNLALAVLIHKSEPTLIEARRFDRRKQPHALDHVSRGAANVHRLAARARRGRTFDNGHLEASARKPMGKRGTRDAGP